MGHFAIMAEPISTGGLMASKFFPPLMGLLGSLITLSYAPEFTKRQWGAALTIGVFGAYLVTPIFSAYIRYSECGAWLPKDGSVEGLIGLLIGMAGIHLVGGFTALGKKFTADPLGVFKQIRFGSRKDD